MDQQEQRAWDLATKVPAADYIGPVFLDGIVFDSVIDLVNAYGGNPPRSGVFGSTKKMIQLDADNIVDELVMCEAAPDWYQPDPAAIKFIGDFVDLFNELYATPSYFPDETIGIVFGEAQQ